MIKRTIFEGIGFGKFADSTIAIIEQFSPSNDYCGTFIKIDGDLVADSDSTIEAMEKAFGDDLDTMRFIALLK